MKLRKYWTIGRDDNNIYWNVLCQTFSRIEAQPKKKGRVLSVACGRLQEWQVISDFFQTKDVYGIDIDAEQIKDAQQMNANIPQSNLEVWDATNIQKTFREKFDVILLRHPHPTEDIRMWQKILQSTIEMLEKDGLLILTTFSLSELQIMIKMLLFIGVRIPLVTENKHPHNLLKMYDAYICVIQKGRVVRDFKQRLDTLLLTKNLPDMTSTEGAVRALMQNL